jgi:hypothetical protein
MSIIDFYQQGLIKIALLVLESSASSLSYFHVFQRKYLKVPGDIPKIRLNTLEKLKGSLKPNSCATSFTDESGD